LVVAHASFDEWLTEDLSDAVNCVASTVRNNADEADNHRRLSASTVECLSAEGLLALLLPDDVGGPGHLPTAALSAMSAIAAHDGAAGWCSMISSTTCLLAGFLDTATAQTTFGEAAAVGGVFAPDGTGRRIDGGVLVSGGWQWGSGLHHCDWIVAGVALDDGDRVTIVVPKEEVTLHDTWQTVGMRGTGSVDFTIDNVVIPHTRVIPQIGAEPISSDPLVRLPNFSILGAGVAAVALGVAERAWSEAVILANERSPQFSRRLLSQQASVQATIARSRSRLDAAGGELFRSVERAYQMVLGGEKVPVSSRVRIRGAAAHAVEESSLVANEMFRLAGGAAVYDSSVLGRCLRNLSVIPQHIMVAPRLFESLGRHHLGLEFDSAMI
jgi:alkylation response protein AidB-like acyl-CoA dehydrogenase